DLLQILSHGGDRLGVGDGDPDVDVAVVDRALEGVREGEEGESGEAAVEPQDLQAGQDVRGDVVVGEHHPLGLPRRAARVDEGGEVLAADGARQAPEIHDVH